MYCDVKNENFRLRLINHLTMSHGICFYGDIFNLKFRNIIFDKFAYNRKRLLQFKDVAKRFWLICTISF